MRQECGTFKSVASCPDDWLLLVLAMRTQGPSLTKSDGKIDESSKAVGDGKKLSIIHCMVDKAMNM
jgi:hypothetical protein